VIVNLAKDGINKVNVRISFLNAKMPTRQDFDVPLKS
jgi:hypothetical protein